LQRASEARQRRVEKLEQVIAEREAALKDLETRMSQPDFYTDQDAASAAAAQHRALMWEIGELMHQWEELQAVSQDG
ncbi:MAG TPA: ABC transporter ATP-binding protein, partial [Acidobacteria bacterium]|nr:ABC transporter ATP-binding protein [Acidobacteriota bacterium]